METEKKVSTSMSMMGNAIRTRFPDPNTVLIVQTQASAQKNCGLKNSAARGEKNIKSHVHINEMNTSEKK